MKLRFWYSGYRWKLDSDLDELNGRTYEVIEYERKLLNWANSIGPRPRLP